MNKAILVGNLTRDPEARTTGSGTAVTTFTVACQRRFANAQGVREADFINVVTWRQTAELCAKYLAKGRRVGVVGSIQTRSYEAQDGTKRYVTEVIADEVEFLSSRSESSKAGLPEEPPPVTTSDGFTQVDDDELPF